jgi:hypothetical protein
MGSISVFASDNEILSEANQMAGTEIVPAFHGEFSKTGGNSAGLTGAAN